MDDLISRQAAIDGADAIIARDTSGNNDVVKAMTAWKRYVEALPTVEGRKKGKWIGEPKDGMEAMFFKPKCSVCGFESADGKNYCPNCGSFNGGEE